MLDVEKVRSRFPALASGAVFLDNPGGTQVADGVARAMKRWLHGTNANHGGAFPTSRASDAIVAEARRTVADFLGAARPEEVVFGPNMTTLTFHLSRSLSHALSPGDEVVVTRLDHDANVAPWLLAAADRGAVVRWLDFDPATGTWSPDDLRALVNERTRIVAVGWASNSLGTVNRVKEAAAIAREAGAYCFVDAVHWAPHGVIDVLEAGCDFLACSAYKFFGPHLGILWGRYDLLDRLTAYKVRPSGDRPPDKWETGTQSFEAIAGTLAALEHVAWVGETFGETPTRPITGAPARPTRAALRAGMAVVREYETFLSRALLDGLSSVPGLRLYGLGDPARLDERVATYSFTLRGRAPREVAEALGAEGIHVWDGNYYALGVTERLGLEADGGMVRVGAVHYNTLEEVGRLVLALRRLSG